MVAGAGAGGTRPGRLLQRERLNLGTLGLGGWNWKKREKSLQYEAVL
jgi:hypothetical protein